MEFRHPDATYLSLCVELILNPPTQGDRGNPYAPSSSPAAVSFQYFPQLKVNGNITGSLLKEENVTESWHVPPNPPRVGRECECLGQEADV